MSIHAVAIAAHRFDIAWSRAEPAQAARESRGTGGAVIDVHTHFLLPEHWGPEYKRHWTRGYDSDWPVISPSVFDAAMGAASVDVAVVFGITAGAAGVRTPSRAVAQFCESVETETVGFMALDPTDRDWAAQLDEGLELGLHGVKVYPVMAHFDPSSERFDRFYSAVAEAGLPILWHMGATLHSPGQLSHSHPLVVDTVATRFPELRQVIAHLGHPWQRDAVQVLRTNPNVYADISGIWTRPMDGYLALVNAQEWDVIPKLLFGSDFPLWTPQTAVEGLRRFSSLNLDGSLPRVRSETIKQILANDPLRVLGLAAGERNRST